MSNFPLGRIVPENFSHVKNHSLRSLGRKTVKEVEKTLILPSWKDKHVQKYDGPCCGLAASIMLSILNENQCRMQGDKDPYIRYNPYWLYDRAKEVDGFDETNPGDKNGTTVRAVCEVLRKQGHVLWENEDDDTHFGAPNLDYGISAYRWATSVDEVRTTISEGVPIVAGFEWYEAYDTPIFENDEWWITRNAATLGTVRGGHSLCIFGASDLRGAVRLVNSWHPEYPEVWMNYEMLERQIKNNAELGLVSDI